MRVVLFCHVEPGTSRDREVLFHPRYEEGIVEALPRIVEFADSYGLPVAFAMTPAALKRNATDLGGHEVGVHLHPHDSFLREEVGRRIELSSDCLADYTAMDQKTLIETAKGVFEDVEGRSPRTFVAGNWSENNTTMRLLCEIGFGFDGSPLPGHLSACADWIRIPRLAQPYSPSVEDYQSRGSMNLLYIPVYQGLWNSYLTPENIHVLGASYFKAALREALTGGAEVVHMFFHSPMAMDPFYLSEFAHVVEFAQDELGVRFASALTLTPSDKLSARPFPPAYLAHLNWRLIKSLVGRGELGRRLMDLAESAQGPSGPSLDTGDEEVTP